MASPGNYDPSIYRGDDWSLPIALQQPDGTAVDLTGATVSAQMRRSPDDEDVSADITATITDPTGGAVLLELDAATTAALPHRMGHWDMQVTDSAGVVTTWLRGTWTVTADVTRSV